MNYALGRHHSAAYFYALYYDELSVFESESV